MPEVLENKIVKAIPDGSSMTVRLEWTNGCETTSDFSKIAGKGIFLPMLKADFFNAVSIQRNGRVLSWPGELDFDADSLWFESHPEDAPAP